MDASQTCDSILSQIKQSNLNYSLTESPFSYQVSIKKTFITDQNGKQITGFKTKIYPETNLLFEIGALKRYIAIIEEENASLTIQNQKAKLEICELCEDKNRINLEKEKTEKELAEEKVRNLKLKVEVQVSKYFMKKSKEEENNEMEYLKINNKNLKVAMKRLHKGLSEAKTRLKKDKDEAIKELKLEIKQWKKDLGRERSVKINLEKKLAKKESDPTEPRRISALFTDQPSVHAKNSPVRTSLQNSNPAITPLSGSCINNNLIDSAASVEISYVVETCSICAEPIPDYIPKYTQGLLINPACKNCDDYEDDPDEDESYENPG